MKKLLNSFFGAIFIGIATAGIVHLTPLKHSWLAGYITGAVYSGAYWIITRYYELKAMKPMENAISKAVSKALASVNDWEHYMYRFKPGQLMVGLIRGVETKDYYYLTKAETAKYLKTGELPEKKGKNDEQKSQIQE